MIEPLFQIENLRVAYPQKNNLLSWVVDDVSLSLNPGEKLALVGESGCGKSTLGRAAMRLLNDSTYIEGEVKFKGKSVFTLTSLQLRQFRGEAVALVFQDPMTRLDPLMTIGHHCLETLYAHFPQLSRAQAKEKALAILASVKIPAERWSQYPHQFSGGMRQRVAIALALLVNPQLIVADEPTTSLDVTVAAEILQELTRLCQEHGMAMILISHDLALVSSHCDTVAVMHQGKIVEHGRVNSVLVAPQHEYTQSLLEATIKPQGKKQKRLPISKSKLQCLTANLQPQSTPLLKLGDVSKNYTLETQFWQQFLGKNKKNIIAVDQVSFELYEGEILGLVGESGCGKSTLSRTILQLIPSSSGVVTFAGKNLKTLNPQQMRSLRRQMQMIFQDPHACLNPLMTVGVNITEPLLIHQIARGKDAQKQVIEMLQRVGLTPGDEYYHRYPQELSGGQQQRVAIARALITHPQLIICDEPVSMLDANVQKQVLELMLDLKSEFSLTYLFITHDLSVARFLCDRLAVMNQGKIVEIGDTEEIFTNPQHPYTQKLLQAAPKIKRD